MEIINGGVTAPQGFFATGVACGIKKDGKKDLAIVCSEDPAAVAGVFTTNIVKGNSLLVTMENIKNGYASAVVINSGNANACNGSDGYENALEIASYAASLLDCSPQEILIGSTGVIGLPIDVDKIKTGLDEAVAEMSSDGGSEASEAIMTTDTIKKEIAVEFEIGGQKVRIGAMAKGSGMIHPNMATMIGIITTDANISRKLLDNALKKSVDKSFNRISVDGETSVCDMVIALANGLADNEPIVSESKSYNIFCDALEYVCTYLAKLIAKDGEGATKLIEIKVKGAATREDAYKAVAAVAKSPLVKTAVFGNDPNWGRIITAAGYSGAAFDPCKVDIWLGDIHVCSKGNALEYDENQAKNAIASSEVSILIDFNIGEYEDRYWTCDFSYDYIKINASYRT